jgi:hypothetical protein
MSGPAETTPEEQRWLREVVEPDFGDAVVDPSWRTWLHEVFATEGGLDGSVLWARSLKAQQEVAAAACERVAADVARTTGRIVTIQPVVTDYNVLISCEGAFSNHNPVFFSIGAEEAAVAVADTVRDILVEEWGALWPQCTEHDTALEPHAVNGSAVWDCERGGHSYPIGELTRPAGDGQGAGEVHVA